ncbi:MAG: hypothetical protein RL030_485 [Pseudomonadota bacterium]|jgi:hypothetical protein
MKHRMPSTGMLATLVLPALALAALAAEPLGLKPGLWETTIETSMTGSMVPEETLQKMSPQQREQSEQMMKQMAARGPTRSTTKSCVTAEDLKDGVFNAARDGDNENCRYDVVTATAKHQEQKVTCGGDTPMEGRVVFEATDSAHVQGDMQMKAPRGSVTMKFRSRWLSASCAGADDE